MEYPDDDATQRCLRICSNNRLLKVRILLFRTQRYDTHLIAMSNDFFFGKLYP